MQDMLVDVIGLLITIEKICLSNDSSKYCALQNFIAQKRLFNFRQVNVMSLGNYHEEFEMLVRVAYKGGGDLVTLECI